MAEKATLLEAIEDGEILILLDGRELQVNPGDIPTTILWLPTTKLEIARGSGKSMFPLKVRNVSNDQEASAYWIHK